MSERSVFIGVATLCAAGLLGYAAYFDYKRRNDIDFRKQLRKHGLSTTLTILCLIGICTSGRDQKKVESKRTRDKLAEPTRSALGDVDLASSLAQISSETLPTSLEGKEQYMLENLGKGEQLALLGM